MYWLDRPINQPLSRLKPVTQEIIAQPAVLAATAAPAAQAATSVCGNSGSMSILLNGIGIAKGEYNADALRFVSIDFDNQRVVVIAFPRDLLLTISRLPDKPQARIGPAYHLQFQATPGSLEDKNLAGTELVSQALLEHFGLLPDYYITLRLDAWAHMIDAIGGVQVNVPTALALPDGTTIQPGTQVLDGWRSMNYIRLLERGEAGRWQRQNIYFQALRGKILNAGIIPKLPDLLQQFDQVIFTDLSPAQLGELTCLLEKTPAEQVYFYEISGDLVSARSDGTLIPDLDKINAFLIEKLAPVIK
jgi:LCP family protein required for cell wall assembly